MSAEEVQSGEFVGGSFDAARQQRAFLVQSTLEAVRAAGLPVEYQEGEANNLEAFYQAQEQAENAKKQVSQLIERLLQDFDAAIKKADVPEAKSISRTLIDLNKGLQTANPELAEEMQSLYFDRYDEMVSKYNEIRNSPQASQLQPRVEETEEILLHCPSNNSRKKENFPSY
jgi:hypothetical protein